MEQFNQRYVFRSEMLLQLYSKGEIMEAHPSNEKEKLLSCAMHHVTWCDKRPGNQSFKYRGVEKSRSFMRLDLFFL